MATKQDFFFSEVLTLLEKFSSTSAIRIQQTTEQMKILDINS